jgi:CheY-like chemotaxis protein
MTKNRTQSASILLIDDNKSLVITLTDYLTYEGFDVVSAGTGEQALATLETLTPDLIILDISMPGIGGIGFLKTFNQGNALSPCPIIVFTARSVMEDFFETLDVAAFVSKPCTEAALLAKIKHVLATQPVKVTSNSEKTKTRSILLGEDDSFVIERLARELTQAGFKLAVATTGPEILERAAVLNPDAILMKNILPGMNGRVVAPLIRAMPSTTHIPIILYDSTCPTILYNSTCSTEEDTRGGRRTPAGVTQYITTDKSEVLLDAIKQHVR